MKHLPSNYCTHFIDSFVNRGATHSKQIDVLKSIDFLAVSKISQWIEKSQKYFLPLTQKINESDSLVNEFEKIRSVDFDLPFPIISLEYKTDSSEMDQKYDEEMLWQTGKGKRISLILNVPPKGSSINRDEFRRSCFFQSLEPSLWFDLDARGGIVIFSLRFEEAENSWSIALGLFSMPRPLPEQPQGLIDWHCFAPALLGTYARLAQQHEHKNVQKSMRKDLEQDVLASIRFIRLMGCSNIQTHPLENHGLEKLNKRREAAKKCPLFSYRNLSVNASKGRADIENMFAGRLDFKDEKKESLFFII